jgi:hypothetical protein
MTRRRGNCYVATEALWHILGGARSAWKVMRLRVPGDTHWFLKHARTGQVLDPSRRQFARLPSYARAQRAGFLTQRPSRRARALIRQLTYQ